MSTPVQLVIFEDSALESLEAWPIPCETDEFTFAWHDTWNAHASKTAHSLGIPPSRFILSDLAYAEAFDFAINSLSGLAIAIVDLDFTGRENSPQTALVNVLPSQRDYAGIDWHKCIGANWQDWLASRPGLILAAVALTNTKWAGHLYLATSAQEIDEEELPNLWNILRQLNKNCRVRNLRLGITAVRKDSLRRALQQVIEAFVDDYSVSESFDSKSLASRLWPAALRALPHRSSQATGTDKEIINDYLLRLTRRKRLPKRWLSDGADFHNLFEVVKHLAGGQSKCNGFLPSASLDNPSVEAQKQVRLGCLPLLLAAVEPLPAEDRDWLQGLIWKDHPLVEILPSGQTQEEAKDAVLALAQLLHCVAHPDKSTNSPELDMSLAIPRSNVIRANFNYDPVVSTFEIALSIDCIHAKSPSKPSLLEKLLMHNWVNYPRRDTFGAFVNAFEFCSTSGGKNNGSQLAFTLVPTKLDNGSKNVVEGSVLIFRKTPTSGG